MRKFAFPALAALAVSAMMAMSSGAEAQIVPALGAGSPTHAVVPAQWGPPPGPPRWDRPPPRRWAPPPPPRCWMERRWVETPWGPRPRSVRVCR